MAKALGTVQDVRMLRASLRWTLPAAKWADVVEALGRIADATARHDPSGVRAGVVRLSLCGPTRVVTRMTSDVEAIPAPVTVVELVNRMIHSLELPEDADDPPHCETDG